MSQTISKEKDDAKITIQGVEWDCVVCAEFEVEGTPSYGGYQGGRMEDAANDPPYGAEIEVISASVTVVIMKEDGEEVGTLKLEGTDWYDHWFDDPEEDDIDWELMAE